MSKCRALTEVENEDWTTSIVSLNCNEDAEYISCYPITGVEVCAAHRCRCNRTIARSDAEKEPTPASWMAL